MRSAGSSADRNVAATPSQGGESRSPLRPRAIGWPASTRRVLPALALLLPILLALGVQGADARRGWCRVDPVVEIAGQTAHIWVASTTEMRKAASGPVQIVVTLPEGITGREIPAESGAGFGFGIKVKFKESEQLRAARAGVQVRVAAHAPAHDQSLPVRLSFKPVGRGLLSPGAAVGVANDWVSLTTGP